MEEDQIALARRFSPSVPGWLKANPVWEVTHNSEGFRDREFTDSKAPSSFRIVCLGDSWTWGNNVNEAQSYPQRLAELLREAFPNRQIEVLNLGVPGYSSYQGLKLLQDRALRLHPDVVLIGFAMNDAVVAGWRDKDAPLHKNSAPKPILENYFQSGKLLRYLLDVSRFQPIPMSDHLRAMTDADKMISREGWAAPETLDAVAYERYESKTRVSPMDYDSNIREMIRLIRNNGGTAIMLYNEVARGNQYQLALQKISKETGAPFVDGSALIAEARQQIEREIEQRLGLQAQRDEPKGAQPEGVEVVFRVFMGEYPVPKAVYVVGPHPLLGDAMPNSVAMYDDGTHGDQKAGDNVWTYTASFAPGTKIYYVYTNSGQSGRWENLDVPKVRSFVVTAKEEARVYLPIDSFGKIYMQADPTHPTAAGYDLIARGVLDVLKKTERFENYLSR
jgi:lysophospholipase L1-like esterase